MNDWLSGARNWWATRSLHKKAEAGKPLLYRDDEDATLNGNWGHFLISFCITLWSPSPRWPWSSARHLPADLDSRLT
jgi:hypothetical protein